MVKLDSRLISLFRRLMVFSPDDCGWARSRKWGPERKQTEGVEQKDTESQRF